MNSVSSFKLCVAIPTYERREQLAKTLKAVMPQLVFGVELLVIDNASSYDVEGILAGIDQKSAEGSIRVIQNRFNVGPGANLARCWENSQARWTWTLGDDDPPVDNAVESILADIDKIGDDNVVFLNYSTPNQRHVAVHSVNSLAEYWRRSGDDSSFFSNLLFMSSGVYRTDSVCSELRFIYHWLYSCGPHVGWQMRMLQAGMTISLRPSVLIPTAGPAEWNPIRVLLGLPTLFEIERLEGPWMKDFCRLYTELRPVPFFKSVCRFSLKDTDRRPRYWKHVFWRLIPYVRGRHKVVAMVGWFLACLAICFPFLNSRNSAYVRNNDQDSRM